LESFTLTRINKQSSKSRRGPRRLPGLGKGSDRTVGLLYSKVALRYGVME